MEEQLRQKLASGLRSVERKKAPGDAASGSVESKTATMASDGPTAAEWFLTNIELWQPAIAARTMKTAFVALTADDARALVAEHDAVAAAASAAAAESASESAGSAAGESKSAADDGDGFACKDSATLARLSALAAKIDASLAAEFKTGSGGSAAAFIKLSCRSPKDATVMSGEMQALYRARIASIPREDVNGRVCALYQSHLEALRMTGGAQALRLFARSGRVREDLLLAIDQDDERGRQRERQCEQQRQADQSAEHKAGSRQSDVGAAAAATATAAAAESPPPPPPFPVQVVLRAWHDIPIGGEFRGFVSGGRLTAVSQYFDTCFFAAVARDKDAIARRLEAFFDKEIRPLVAQCTELAAVERFIIDFAITADDRVLVVELNPWSTNTDAGLFAWSRDRKVLENGPLEIRVVQKALPAQQLQKAVFEVWRPLLSW